MSRNNIESQKPSRLLPVPAVILLVLLSFARPGFTYEGLVEFVSGQWTAEESPYYFDDTLVVEHGSELWVMPGVEVILGPNVAIIVHGLLNASGTSANPIIFRGGRTADEWEGIHFMEDSDLNSSIRFSRISDCYAGIVTNGNHMNTIYGNTIQARTVAIRCNSASPQIENNYLSAIDDRWASEVHCISLNDRSYPLIINNPLILARSQTGGRAYGIMIRGGAAPQLIEGNWIQANTTNELACGINISNADAMLIRRNIILTSSFVNQKGLAVRQTRDLMFINNTLMLLSSSASAYGIMLTEGGSNFTIMNNIVAGNGASVGISTERGQISQSSGYNNFWMHATRYLGDWRGFEDINSNPQFLSTTYGDIDAFHLDFPGSPCIDAGNPEPMYNDPDGTRSDMGRYWTNQPDPNRMNPVTISPEQFTIPVAYPNPFNSQTTLSWTVGIAGTTRLTVYNTAGRLVDSITMENLPAGNQRVVWNGTGLPAGVYVAQIEQNGQRKAVRMVLIP